MKIDGKLSYFARKKYKIFGPWELLPQTPCLSAPWHIRKGLASQMCITTRALRNTGLSLEQDGSTLRYGQNLRMAYFKDLPYRTNVTYHKKKMHAYRTYELFIGWWYALSVPHLRGTIRACERGFRGYIVPGPRPRGARAQGAQKNSGFRVKFWYGTTIP